MTANRNYGKVKKMLKKIFILFFLFFLFNVHLAEAKLLPQAKTGTKVASGNSNGAVTVSPRLRKDRLALIISFRNLQNAKSVSYILTYETNGQQEGAQGSTSSAEGNFASRELLFGTCSKNDCRYHSNIKNMRLEVTIESKAGKKTLKRYRINV